MSIRHHLLGGRKRSIDFDGSVRLAISGLGFGSFCGCCKLCKGTSVDLIHCFGWCSENTSRESEERNFRNMIRNMSNCGRGEKITPS